MANFTQINQLVIKERKETVKFTRTKDIFSTEKMQSQVILLMLLLSSRAFRPTYKHFHLKQHFQNVNGLKKIKIVLIRVKRSKQKNKQGTLVYTRMNWREHSGNYLTEK